MDSRYSNLGDFSKEAMMARMVGGNATLKETVLAEHCDNVYYSESSAAMKSECDTVANSRYSQGFPSLALPGSALLQIPNQSIVDMVTIHAEFNPAQIPADVCLPRGWLLLLINRIDYRIGSSTTFTMDGKAHLQLVFESCETSDKIDQIWRLAGDEFTTGPNSSTLVAHAPIMVPISKLMAMNNKLPFDTRMLSQPVNVTVYFDALSSICGGIGTPPSSFSLGEYILRQMDFKDVEHSLARDLQMNSISNYTHPFTFVQQVGGIQLTSSNTKTAPVATTLQGFRYGNLLGIAMMAVLNSSSNPAPTVAKNPLDTLRLENINLNFNGQNLQVLNGRAADLLYLEDHPRPNYFFGSRLSGTTNASFSSVPVNSYFYVLDLSQYSAIVKEGSVQSGIEIGSNVMTLSFTTPDSNAAAFTLYVSYRYQAGIKVSQGGNAVDFVF